MDNMGSGMDEGEDSSAPESSSDSEMPSVFLSKEQLGGKTVKAGDTITMKVLDVDPESGDAEVECSATGAKGETDTGGYASAFDRAMPEEG